MVSHVLGALIVAFGLVNVVWPYKVARFEEQLDAIGSKRSWDEVEPAEWKVTLTRGIGVVIALFGVAVFLSV
ncbi:hypothetical protein BRC88_12395 [Halobacteriales archaeon QS_4_69_225]|nr:MAG: hypothetical protein BRC88_12395 [Halobacteriales archaeon QS_4_69_225]